jgi:hypothetical protein
MLQSHCAFGTNHELKNGYPVWFLVKDLFGPLEILVEVVWLPDLKAMKHHNATSPLITCHLKSETGYLSPDVVRLLVTNKKTLQFIQILD